MNKKSFDSTKLDIIKPSQLYPYIYDFLLKCGHVRAAKKFLKETQTSENDIQLRDTSIDLIDMFSLFTKSAIVSEKINVSFLYH
jgi:hypothetical protein